MNDRFKFRVWSKKYNQYLQNNRYPIGSDDILMLEQDGTLADLELGDGYTHIYAAKPQYDTIIETCTGLKDKNGNLIYEGDIVRQGDILKDFTIKWVEHGFDNPTNGINSLFDCPNEWEIVGNIHIQETKE